MRTRELFIVGLTVVAASGIARPQSYPQPETMLSGINIYRSSIHELERKLGNAQSVTDGERYGNKVRTYEWQNGSTRLRVVKLAEKHSDTVSGGIFSIDVWDHRDRAGLGISGEGLRLGDQLKDAKRIYGVRLKKEAFGSDPLFGHSRMSVNTGEASPVLEIDFDPSGGITHLRLVNPCVPQCL